MSILLLNASLAERPKMVAKGEEIVALGFLGIQDIVADNGLVVDNYQREVLKNSSSLDAAAKNGTMFPTITLGVRGSNYKEQGSSMMISDLVYVIDGLQRISALRRAAEENPEETANLTIGAEIRFGTTHETEKRLFHILNSKRVAVSPNILLRNMRDKYRALLTIYGVSTNVADSPLFGKVQWGQRAAAGELVTAMMIVRTMLRLYQHVSTKEIGAKNRNAASGGVEGSAQWLENKSKAVGLDKFRANLLTFFEVIDEVWGVRHVEANASRAYLKFSFLQGLGMLLSENIDFWKGPTLVVPAHIKSRLKSFPFLREDIAMILRGSAGSGSGIAVCDLLTRHINRGKSTRKLRPRSVLIQD